MNPSQSPRLSFGFQFVTLARQWRQAVDERLAATGLTDATWAPLVHLQENGDDITQKELAARMGLDGSTLVRLIDILAAKDLVERRTDLADRRSNRLLLTATGKAQVRKIRRLLSEVEAEFLSDISDQDIAVMLRAFLRVRTRLGGSGAAVVSSREPR